MTLLGDLDIRRPLHQWLVKTHVDCPGTEIIHEMKMPRPSARIDLAVINGELVGYEIKSDLDTLVRLSRQARAFNAVFERVCIVTTEKHAAAVRAAIPIWWGIIVPTASALDEPFFFLRTSGENPAVDIEAMLHVLHRRELLSILEMHDLSRGVRSKERPLLIAKLLTELPSQHLKLAAREALKARARYSSSSLSY
ncbi:MAG TPA: sce7726 family protein [Pseudolabrys sp.]|nr:sce7726 family protein [Pseudolabrys sp.]